MHFKIDLVKFYVRTRTRIQLGTRPQGLGLDSDSSDRDSDLRVRDLDSDLARVDSTTALLDTYLHTVYNAANVNIGLLKSTSLSPPVLDV